MAFYVFLHSHFADWEISYILPEPVEFKHPVVRFGLSEEPVISLGGLKVIPETSLSKFDLKSVDFLLLPGGDFWNAFSDSRFESFIRDLRGRGRPVGAICAATGYLARLGFLDDVKHTSNDLEFLKKVAPKYKGEKLYSAALATHDNGIFTASGIGHAEFTRDILINLKLYSEKEAYEWYGHLKKPEAP
jgi:putative intracellular protease/amidase